MSKTIHRQIGKLGSRTADEASVAMIIKEVDDTDILLGKLIQHTNAWRDAWSDILVNESRIADSLHDVYQTLPRTGDSANPPPETPAEVLQRVAELRTTYDDLKEDMMVEVGKVETLLISPMTACQANLKPVKKAIQKRENKKLDYERYQKQVDHTKGKKNKSEREYSVQSRAEADLEKATNAYQIADDYLREYIPSILTKILEFIPLVVEISVQIQFTLLQHSYSAFFHYASEHGFDDTDSEMVVAQWEEVFLPIQKETEQGCSIIKHGKAILMPMSQLGQESVIKAKVSGLSMPSIGGIGRSKKVPPPPPPPATSSCDGGHSPSQTREYSKERSLGKQGSNASIGSRVSRKDHSPTPPVPSDRPAIRGRISSNNLHREEREDESPQSQLPRSRPTSNGNDREDPKPSAFRASSYCGMGRGSVQATPLAGLRPSQLRGNSDNLKPTDNAVRPSLISSGRPATTPAAIPATKPPTTTTQFSSLVAGKKKPPPPPPKKKFAMPPKPKEPCVKALFDFEGQDVNDLNFREGDIIKIVKKTDSTDDWWEGELSGRKGTFPANYTELV